MGDAKVVPGSPPAGVAEGTMFTSRNELADSGVHGVRMQGIWTSEGRVIGIVLNGGYEDDADLGDVIHYTGDGGRDPNTGKQVDDQGFTAGNRGLVIASALKKPIRVTRGWKCKSDLAPAKGFRYDGLYDVASYAYVRGSEGYFVWRFTLTKHSYSTDEAVTELGLPADFGSDDFNVFLRDEESGPESDDVSRLVAMLTADAGTDELNPYLLGMDLRQPEDSANVTDFEPLQLSGSGNQVIRLEIPEGLNTSSKRGAAVLLRWRQYGEWDGTPDYNDLTPDFKVNFFKADGTESPTRLFELWGYEGSQVLVFDEVPVACEVLSSARWSIQLDKVLSCPKIAKEESGTCNSVYRFIEYTKAAHIVRVLSDWKQHDGYSRSGQFSLRAYGRFGQDENDSVTRQDLLTSTYDENFSGSRVLPKGTVLVEVLAPGRTWSLSLEDL